VGFRGGGVERFRGLGVEGFREGDKVEGVQLYHPKPRIGNFNPSTSLHLSQPPSTLKPFNP
jgi:hypothetical protein